MRKEREKRREREGLEKGFLLILVNTSTLKFIFYLYKG